MAVDEVKRAQCALWGHVWQNNINDPLSDKCHWCGAPRRDWLEVRID